MVKKLEGDYSVADFEEYVRVFKKHEKNLFMEDIARGMYGFQWELESFYDISSTGLGEERPYRIGKIPEDLLEILQDLSNEGLDAGKLTYECVRSDFQPPETKGRKIGRRMLLGTAVAVGISAPITYAITDSHQITSSVGSLLGLVGGLSSIPFLAQKNDSEGIFYKLLEAAEKADSFRPHYVSHKRIENAGRDSDYDN